MIKKHFIEKVVSQEEIAENTYLMKLTCAQEAIRIFRAGQFMHIEIPHARELLLRRPISINYVDVKRKEVHIVYNAIGKGTRLLTLCRPGDMLDILMPLGNGFTLPEDAKKIWLIGGGVGIAPLKSIHCNYPDKEYSAFLGYRNADCVYQVQDFEKFAKTYVTTDDGSFGTKGFCTQVLADQLKSETPDMILACGPTPFFRSLAKVVGDVPTLVSLEQRMGCGTGGCAVCACSIRGEYKKVCLNGPVFPIKEVDALYD
ncbi:MAG: dihydroorotate dehydrogenase electron transfer subunit [Christensenella sp.]|nr:dihydroorotate dehydrogenase electron transfer subunit [Christensenella sp.]